ncbi:NFX1-type zinc finger-containing protein 1 [Rhizophagus clarus]|uniref:NFX1-type zinc finger-containing protein 1 n=1 Tax=Rhizophagus clarus TaxID=94130 RepID=A0A8H3R3E6_9GLOM|nr:NFX1-type zinc finger-containing protein 1 [Rhizophagus clarus]
MSGKNFEYNKSPSRNRHSNIRNSYGTHGVNIDDNSQRHNNNNNNICSPRRNNNGQGRGFDDQSYQYKREQSSPYPISSSSNRINHRRVPHYKYRTIQNRPYGSHIGSPTREEQENPRSSSSDYLACWGESPSENCGESIEERKHKVAAGDPFPLKLNPSKEAPGVFKGRETKPNTDGYNDDEVDWVISDQFASSSSPAIRPQTPPFYLLDKEVENKKVPRNNRERFKISQDQCYEEEFPNNGEDNYKGISFPPPYPIVPVSPDIEQPMFPDIGRIFENDSRSSAQSFENLSKIAKTLWSDSTDVPLDLASKQDVNPDEYLREKLKEVSVEYSNEYDLEPKWLEERDCSDMRSYNPKLTNNKSSLFAEKRCTTFNQSTLKPDLRDFGFVKNTLISALRVDNIEKKNLARNPSDVNSLTVEKCSVIEIVKETSIISLRTEEEEVIRDEVNTILRLDSKLWLITILSQAHKLIPKISIFDAQTIQNFLKILSSPVVLKENHTQTKHLIDNITKQADFFEKIFSYMRRDVNFGSDLLSIIRLTNYIVKFFPEVDLNIPYNDIDEVYMRVKNTFTKSESDEATTMLERIKIYQPKKVNVQRISADQNVINQKREVEKVVERRKSIEPKKAIEPSKPKKTVVIQREVPDQKREKEEPKKPDWIIHHSETRVEKPMEPFPDEIFNLREMMTKPTLTPHLASRSWSPKHEEIYRQIHYDLLRTEVVEDLQRASISFFADNCKEYITPMNSPFYNYVYYRDVQVVDTYIDKNFVPYVRVGFKPSRLVDWIKGEHLIYGTFVLLFKVKTEFNNLSIDISSMTWAMVGHFNLDDVVRPNGNEDQCWKLRESFVGLNFSSSEFEKLDINGKYVMLESTRNYATIRPVMEWLKESGIQRFIPLYQELFTCSLVKEVKENNENKSIYGYLGNVPVVKDTENKLIPGYLERVSFDITSILVDQKKQFVAKDLSQWPSYLSRNGPSYNMERSCVVALRHIISNKVAVIMAPIITSKAKVASKAVELLNQALEQSHCHEPILILTRSSYALDSILEQLLLSFPDLVRCGSLSKCRNPALKARQIQDVVEENSKKTSLRRGWFNISSEIISKQRELTELWKLRKYGLSLQYFLETCPKVFREQLCPMNLVTRYRNFGFETEKALLNLTEEDFPTFPSSRHNLHRTETALPANPYTRSNVVQGSNQEMNVRPYDHVSPSLFDELSKSYLFENDWMKNNGCNDDEISIPTDSDKEILNHQIDDRVIFKPEECHQINYNNLLSKHKLEFVNVAKGFWGNSGKNIWDMGLDERKSLYDRFCQRHKEFCDPKIRGIQKSAILDAENAKSTLIARWTEVCSFVPVIGMTVNYATIYRELLTTIKPRICIVDEASEILESQLMYLISSDRLEHLIMFGDTNYSKPDVKSYTAQKHGLGVSLFERWIKCDGKTVCLKQQSRMHPAVHELVRTFYDEDRTENIVKENIPKIKGVSSNVFFMTHNNFDKNWTSFKKTNVFEAKFIIKFAFYLYQQGYDPAKITILTPYLGQKLLILNLLKPELKRDLSKYNLYGRFDKERSQAGKIRVELIDNYTSEENEIVLLSLVSVSKNWHEEALKTLNNKKRAIIALSRALHALYIFGNDELLCKSEIWAPIVKLTRERNTHGKSFILSCDTHNKKRIEIATLEDFDIKVPYGGCSESCAGLLNCGHMCSRKCHPIKHANEVNYICNRQCDQPRPKGCSHKCSNKCYDCEKLGKCPPCEKDVRIKLSCGHIKLMSCRRTYNVDRMNVECSEKKEFKFNCGHITTIPCGTRFPICQETCGKPFPCGHRCQRQCGTEHNHERSDCLSECTKVLICGHQCANGCNEPNRHTSFCSKQCRIKCMHGRVCPKACFEKCTSCREPCPWKCQHHKCNRKCFELCDRNPCTQRCQEVFKCGHKCNGYCGEKCPPCLKCNPNLQCRITLLSFSEMEENEPLYVLPECNCVFIASGLDSYFNNQAKNGDHTAVKLWQCPSCQEPIFTAMRYNEYLKSEINLWNIIKHKQEIARNSLSEDERRQIINAMNEETRTTDFNSMVGGRWFVCPNKHPYYIGNCGGATQISKCPDCSATIGGTQHKVVNSNRFYGEFDNSTSPAWPGQH